MLKHAQEQYDKKTQARLAGFCLDRLIERVAEHLRWVPAGVLSPGRQREPAHARSLICALAVDYLGLSGRELSRRLNLSPSAVSKLVQRGRRDQQSEKLAQALFDR